jgi:beta-phosphoglucomutase-like phosphatase (HAD superfamily)
VCPHGRDEGCACRKPEPGLILRAARALGVEPHQCVVIGDIGSDVEAARAAGARGILVPTPVTAPQECGPGVLAADLTAAVRLALRRAPARSGRSGRSGRVAGVGRAARAAAVVGIADFAGRWLR